MTPVDDRTTARLLLRRVTWGDLAAVVAIESDPRTNEHRPGGAPSPMASEHSVLEFVLDWTKHGMGYWAVEYEGMVVGVAGVRPFLFQGRDCWNLYYRFSPAVWGRGLAVESALEAVAVAEALQPRRPVVARTRPANSAAVRVAEGAGLDRRPDLDSDGFLLLARGW